MNYNKFTACLLSRWTDGLLIQSPNIVCSLAKLSICCNLQDNAV